MEAKVSVPVECKRTQNIVVSEDFISSLKKAFNWGKSEKLPDDSFYPLYVGEGLLEQMEVADNQIVWERRGTGKTHLLKAFTQKVNENQEKYELAYYVSCDNVKLETPANLTFDDDLKRMKYFARETYKAFLINILEQIIDTYQEKLSIKYQYNDFNDAEKKNIHQQVDSKLEKLLEISTTGIPRIIEVTEKDNINKKSHKINGMEQGINIDFSLKKNGNKLLAFFNKNKTKKGEDLKTQEIEKKISYDFSFMEIQRTIEALIKAMKIDMLYICIDELWLIDDKNSISFQPVFLDYLRQTFFGQRGVSVKIASIRETTKLNSKNSAENCYGLQSGHDIMELANLDSMQYSAQEVQEKFLEILAMRVNYFSEEFNKKADDKLLYDQNYIVDMIFKEKRYFGILVSLSNGIPRNFLRVLQLCLVKLNYDLQHYFLHMYLISEIVMSIFVNDRRSNMPMNENSVYNMLNEYLSKSKNIFFIISSEQVKRAKVEINNLIYTEIIHRIPSSVTPSAIMDSYKAYFIDAGKYFYYLKEIDFESYASTLTNFALAIPKDVAENIDFYTLDLGKISVDYLECPSCSATISKTNPVYKKFNCCSICGFEFPKK